MTAEAVVDPGAVGDRITRLLEAAAAAGPLARARSEELVRLVVDLYGSGLERLLDALADAGRLDEVAQQALADDDLVASLLLVHGLHPHDVATRVRRALDEVRPYLGSHGGDVSFLDVTPDGVVRLQFSGTCGSCPSSAATLSLAIEGAVAAAAPETTGVALVEPDRPAGFVPLQAVRVRPRDEPPAGSWAEAPHAAGLADGEVRVVQVAGTEVLVMRAGTDVYAYHDRCPSCGGRLGGAVLARQLGGRGALLRCPGCGAHFDVRRAGAGADVEGHLEPLPLLERHGTVEVAVPAVPQAVTA
jgi:Fe-S cluster biogenesis protein NfuA/nitrite reductase/ring-hydroxylating ferredoxin subunit